MNHPDKEHVGRPCSCGVVACSPERTAYVLAYIKALVGEGPPLDGFRRRRARQERRRRALEAWERAQQHGGAA